MVLSESPTDDVLKETVAAQLREGRRLFVLDLNQVSQMDTSGLTMLVAIYVAVRKQEGRIALVHPSKRVRELLRVTRLDTLFQVFDSENSAIRTLAQESQTSADRT